jgi:hypothetical protein
VYTGKENPFRGWQIFGSSDSQTRQLYIPIDAIQINQKNNVYSLDQWPVDIHITFLSNCWTQVIKGNKKIVEQVYQKGEIAHFRGHHIQVTIGNPAGVKFVLNGKELTYLKTMARSARIDANPTTIKGILDR